MEEGLNTSIYNDLRKRFVTGQITSGHELSTRSLASELGVSQTPVRDALSRLAAEGAIHIRSKRRVVVPLMTADRFEDLLRCRILLEPEAAAEAVSRIGPDLLAHLRACDRALDLALADKNADAYMCNNHEFHFAIYRAQASRTLTALIESLWLQFGPFMRMVFHRTVNTSVNDCHRAALDAIERGDAATLREAIAADIRQGMALIAKGGFVRDCGEVALRS